MKKTDKTDDITITWEPDKFIHSAICFKGMPEVFDPRRKPWIVPENNSTDNIVNQIKNCPSGAISFKYNNETQNENNIEESTTKIQLAENGPLLVNGNVTLVDKEGNETTKEGMTALCRCGESANKPYCDGAHKTCGFKG